MRTGAGAARHAHVRSFARCPGFHAYRITAERELNPQAAPQPAGEGRGCRRGIAQVAACANRHATVNFEIHVSWKQREIQAPKGATALPTLTPLIWLYADAAKRALTSTPWRKPLPGQLQEYAPAPEPVQPVWPAGPAPYAAPKLKKGAAAAGPPRSRLAQVAGRHSEPRARGEQPRVALSVSLSPRHLASRLAVPSTGRECGQH